MSIKHTLEKSILLESAACVPFFAKLIIDSKMSTSSVEFLNKVDKLTVPVTIKYYTFNALPSKQMI